MTGIASVSAAEVGHAQKQINNTSYVQKTNETTINSNISEHSAQTQKMADVVYLKQSQKHKKVFKTHKEKQVKVVDKNQLRQKNIQTVKKYDSIYQKDNYSDIQSDSSITSQKNNSACIQAYEHQYSINNSESFPVGYERYGENSTAFNETSDEEAMAAGSTSTGTYDNPSLSAIIAPASVQIYLTSSANCQSTDPRIKSLAAAITRGIPTGQVYNRANAIFNWVRDNLAYSFYYNTKKGAVGALTSRSANCCDTSHLLVALLRASGIPARYAYGSCQFSSGRYGHVWAQVYICGKWYTADASSNSNSFNVIRNWNTQTYTLKGIWWSLPF